MGAECKNHWSRCCLFLLSVSITGCLSRIPSSVAGNARLFEQGTGQSYQLTSTLVLNDPAERKGKDVGYQIQAEVSVGVVWQGQEDRNEKLLEVQVTAPKLLIKSRKAPTPEGFDVHASQLEKQKNFPFLIHWKNGRIVDIFVDKREDGSVVNFKKGIASLFQFQVLDLETKETDASGDCNVTYKSLDPFSFSKTKTHCQPPSKLTSKIPIHSVLTPKTTSTRTATYKLSQDLTNLEFVSTQEHHQVNLPVRKEAGGTVASSQTLTSTGKRFKAEVLSSGNLEDAVLEFGKRRKVDASKRNLELDAFSPKCDKEDCPSLPKLIKQNRDYLSADSLGTHRSAGAFVRLLSAARTSTKDDLSKAFKGTKNKEILAQLCDLAGATQLPEAHEVIMKILNFDAEADLDNSERYLWSLAAGFHPHESILSDIFKRSQRPHPSEKISETLILTLAAMANKFARIQKSPLLAEISDSILGELELCKDENCKAKYLRALRNLKCPRTIPVLIEHSLKGKKKTSVEALKALRSFDHSFWGPEVIDAAQKIYFQAGRKFDSSSRTIALDILLESNPRREILQELLLSLAERDKKYEVKQYLVQRLRQISEKNLEFGRTVTSIKREFPLLFNNYNTQAQRGLTTAFERRFASDEYRNGSLTTTLEISKGLLKQGLVDVVIETPETTTKFFRLGLFADGLDSFVSSDDKDATEEENEEPATAGMELSVLGAQLRPFVFFSGQAELMGHVWSGTASEKTPAFQALLLAVDHNEYIPLQIGFVAQTEVLGGVSFDLSGQVQISLWNRNAHSLVEKNAGISLQGRIRVDTSFVRSKVEFNTATEMKLNLESDLNFYSGTALCTRLSQPDVVVKQSFHKIEAIQGGKHRLRRSRYEQVVVPGRTYALNKKNDQICSGIID